MRRTLDEVEKPGVPRRLTAAGIKQRRMAGVKHGRRAEVVTETDVVRYRLEKIDPDAPELIEKFARAVGGDPAALNDLLTVGMASKEILRRRSVEEIAARGVIIEEVIVDRDGRVIGRKLKANPLFEPLKHMDEQLGLTADHMRLSRRSRGQGERDDALAAALRRDARLRAADKAGLPSPDPELLGPADRDR